MESRAQINNMEIVTWDYDEFCYDIERLEKEALQAIREN
jgi:hypothetical protein